MGAGLRGRPGRGGSKQAATLIGKGHRQQSIAYGGRLQRSLKKKFGWCQACEQKKWLGAGLRGRLASKNKGKACVRRLQLIV